LKFRDRLLLFGFLVAGLAALGVLLSAEVLIRRGVTDRVTERLHAEARILADMLGRDRSILPDVGASAVDASEADRFAHTAGTDLGLRVTIVAPDGAVLGDSSLDAAALASVENHADRPEIAEARRTGVGTSGRRSATVHDDFFYLARRVGRDGRIAGFVRLAIPVREIERTTWSYSLKLAGLSFVALIAVAILGYVAARRFSRPIEEMSLAADQIAMGNHTVKIDYESGDELGRLGAAVNRMTRSLSDRIRDLSVEKRLRDTMLDGMTEGLLVVDGEHRVILCNKALRSQFDPGIGDPRGRPLFEIARDHSVIETFDAALLRGERRREIVRHHAGGGVLELTVVPLEGPQGGPLGAVGFFFDITRLTALETVRREFVSDVSHELRTPLATIKSFVETLLGGAIDDTTNNRRFLEIVRKNSDRMEAILDDLTDLSAIETGAAHLEMESVDLAPLIRDMFDSLRPAAEQRGVSLAAEIPSGILVRADRRRLEEILQNLLDNAIKFNRQGGSVTVRASIAARPDESGPANGSRQTARIEIEDTGEGIPAESLDRIFHRFYRVDPSRSRQTGGTGLGLAIVKHLVRLHDGTIQVESQIGRGSRFVVELPAE